MASILPGKATDTVFAKKVHFMRPYKILYSPYKILELVERDIFSTESISPIYPVFLLTVATVFRGGSKSEGSTAEGKFHWDSHLRNTYSIKFESDFSSVTISVPITVYRRICRSRNMRYTLGVSARCPHVF